MSLFKPYIISMNAAQRDIHLSSPRPVWRRQGLRAVAGLVGPGAALGALGLIRALPTIVVVVLLVGSRRGLVADRAVGEGFHGVLREVSVPCVLDWVGGCSTWPQFRRLRRRTRTLALVTVCEV